MEFDFALNDRLEVPQPRHAGTNIASQAVEAVISKNRKDRLRRDLVGKELFEAHLQNMKAILDTYEYELMNMQKILSHARKMKIWDIEHYLNALEALAYGYKRLYGTEITIPLLAGIVAKSADLYALNKYYDLLIGEITRRMTLAESKAKIEERKIEELTLKLKYEESSIFKIFKKDRIRRIKGSIAFRKRKAERYMARAEKYRILLSTTKNMIHTEK
ncbi:MAG: hypothetical protein ACP5GB_01595 [Candidatus Micrarchaeia archaeon]